MVEFDDYSTTYRDDIRSAVAFSGQDVDFFTHVKVDDMEASVESMLGPIDRLKVLDVGCGIGETDRLLIPKVKELHGVDVSAGSIEQAKIDNPEGRYQTYDGGRLPYEDNEFDFAFAICVFHHVPPAQWGQLASEMKRVVRPDGLVGIYEHNPWNPMTRWVVNRCEFDHDAVLLSSVKTRSLFGEAGIAVVDPHHILFFPVRSHWARRVERSLQWIPLGAQYAVWGQVPAVADAA